MWTSGFTNGPELIISYRFKFLKSLMNKNMTNIWKIWLISIILGWIEIGMKNPNPPSSALFPFLRLYLKRQKSNYLYLFLRVWLHGGMEPPGGWGNSASCVRKMAHVFFFLFLRRSLRDQKHQEAERRTFSLKDFLRSYRHNSFSVLLLIEPFWSHLSSVAKCGYRLSFHFLVNHPLQRR